MMTSLPLAMVLALSIPSMAGESYVVLEDALIASANEVPNYGDQSY